MASVSRLFLAPLLFSNSSPRAWQRDGCDVPREGGQGGGLVQEERLAALWAQSYLRLRGQVCRPPGLPPLPGVHHQGHQHPRHSYQQQVIRDHCRSSWLLSILTWAGRTLGSWRLLWSTVVETAPTTTVPTGTGSSSRWETGRRQPTRTMMSWHRSSKIIIILEHSRVEQKYRYLVMSYHYVKDFVKEFRFMLPT